MKTDAEDAARGAITDLLRSLCPEQCYLNALEAKVEEETISTTAPGFDAPAGAAKLPTLRSVNVALLLDSELPMAFRTKLKGLVIQRLSPISPQTTVTTENVAFPPRNPQHLEQPEKAPQPQPQPTPPPEPEKSKEEAPVTPPPASITPWLEAATLLAIVLFTGLTLVALGVLLYLALRQRAQPQAPAAAPAFAEAMPAVVDATGAEARPTFPLARRRKLERALRDERVVRNAVVRQALEGGEVKAVAGWTRELGEFLLDDLRGDGALSAKLSQLTSELKSAPEQSAETRAAMLYELEGRLIGARLAEAQDSVDHAFSFLQGVLPERFTAAVRELPPGELDVALRFAPVALRTAALAELSSAQRAELALSLAKRPDVTTGYALSVAEELRARVLDTAGSPAQADRMLVEVLESLPMAEQDRLVERLSREGNVRAARALVTESTLHGTPVEILSATLLGLPPARLVSYLSGAEQTLREKLISDLPGAAPE